MNSRQIGSYENPTKKDAERIFSDITTARRAKELEEQGYVLAAVFNAETTKEEFEDKFRKFLRTGQAQL